MEFSPHLTSELFSTVAAPAGQIEAINQGIRRQVAESFERLMNITVAGMGVEL